MGASEKHAVTRYAGVTVRSALLDRLQFVRQSLAADGGYTFVAAMADAIARDSGVKRSGLFRGHDSGDFFSNSYVDAWCRIADRLPHIRFWFPTREWLIPGRMPALLSFAARPNVVLRPSAAAIDSHAPLVAGLAAGSAVYRDAATAWTSGHYVCPATWETPDRIERIRDSKTRAAAMAEYHSCAHHGCTFCWTSPRSPVAYLLH